MVFHGVSFRLFSNWFSPEDVGGKRWRQAAEHVLAAQQGRGVDATSWWRTSYTDRYMERLRTVLEGGGESPEEGEDEYTWDRNP